MVSRNSVKRRAVSKTSQTAPSAGGPAKTSPSLLVDQGAEFGDQLTDATGLLDVESLRELGGKLVPGITRQNDAGNVARRQSCRSRRGARPGEIGVDNRGVAWRLFDQFQRPVDS